MMLERPVSVTDSETRECCVYVAIRSVYSRHCKIGEKACSGCMLHGRMKAILSLSLSLSLSLICPE